MALFRKTDPKDTFVAAVRKTLNGLGVTGRIDYDPELFALRMEGDRTVMLGNLFGRWQTLSKRDADAYLNSAVGALVAEADQPKTFEAARGRLLPGVRDRSTIESARWMAELGGSPAPPIPYRAIGSTIVAVLVVDSPTSMMMVNEQHLSEWDVSFDEAFSAAVENLSAATEVARWGNSGDGVHLSLWNDDYDISRLLLPHVIDALDVSGHPVAFVPNRNRLIITGADDISGLHAAIDRVGTELDQPSQVSAVPLVREDGIWKDLELESGHPASEELRRLRVHDRALAYGATTAVIQSLVGEELFVANSMLTEKDGSLLSIATWIDGPSIIPEVDQVLFFKSEQEHWMVAWPDVVAHAGHLMQPTDFYPARYRVEAFPSAEQLHAMPLIPD